MESPLSGQIQQSVAKYSQVYGVPEDLIHAVIKSESAYNPYAVSGAGARGLMQLMPATGAEEGLGPNDFFDVDKNIRAGTQYLSKQMAQFGDTKLALAAYNAGPGNVKKYGGIPPFQETINYVSRIEKALGGDSSSLSLATPIPANDLQRGVTTYDPVRNNQESQAFDHNKYINSLYMGSGGGDKSFEALSPQQPEALGEETPDAQKKASLGLRAIQGLADTPVTMVQEIANMASAVARLPEIVGLMETNPEQNALEKFTEGLNAYKFARPEEAPTDWTKYIDPGTILPTVASFAAQLIATGGVTKVLSGGLKAVGMFGKAATAIEAGQVTVDGLVAMAKMSKLQKGTEIAIGTLLSSYYEGSSMYEESFARKGSKPKALEDFLESGASAGLTSIPDVAFVLDRLPFAGKWGLASKLISGGVSGALNWLQEGANYAIMEDDYGKLMEGLSKTGEVFLPSMLGMMAVNGFFGDHMTQQEAENKKFADALKLAAAKEAGGRIYSPIDGSLYNVTLTPNGGVEFTAEVGEKAYNVFTGIAAGTNNERAALLSSYVRDSNVVELKDGNKVLYENANLISNGHGVVTEIQLLGDQASQMISVDDIQSFMIRNKNEDGTSEDVLNYGIVTATDINNRMKEFQAQLGVEESTSDTFLRDAAQSVKEGSGTPLTDAAETNAQRTAALRGRTIRTEDGTEMNVGVSNLLPSQATLDALGIDDNVTTELIAGMTRDGGEVSAELYVAEHMQNAGLLDFSLQDDGTVKIAAADFSSFESQKQADKVITDSRAATLLYAKLVSEVKAHMAESATNENLMQAAKTSDSPTAFELRFQDNMKKYGLQNKYSGVMEILGMPNPVETGEAMARSTWAMIDGIARITGEKPGALLEKHFAGMQAINRKATASTYQGLLNKFGKEPKSKPVPVVNAKTKKSHALHINDDGTATVIPNETKAEIQTRLRSKEVVQETKPSQDAQVATSPKTEPAATTPQPGAVKTRTFKDPVVAGLHESLLALQSQIASGDKVAINNAADKAVETSLTLEDMRSSAQGDKKLLSDIEYLIEGYDALALEAVATIDSAQPVTSSTPDTFIEDVKADARARRLGTKEGPTEHKTKVAGQYYLGYGEQEIIKDLFHSGVLDIAEIGFAVEAELQGDKDGNVHAGRVYTALEDYHGKDVADAIFSSLGYTSIIVDGTKRKIDIYDPLFQSSDNGLTWKSQNGDTLKGIVLDARADQLSTIGDPLTEDFEGGSDFPLASKEGTRIYGVTQFEAQRAMITFFKGANLDTIVHETGHVLRRMLPPEVMKAVTKYSFETDEFDGDPIAPWVATDSDSKVTKRRRRDAEERFTHALVTYLLEGKFGKGIPKEARTSFVKISEALKELKDSAENGIRSEGPMTTEIVQVLNNLGKGSLDVKTIYEYNKTRPEGTRAMKITDLWRGRKANGADTVTMSLLRMWDPEPNKRRDPVKWAEDEAEARKALDEDPDFVGKLVARLNQQGGSITSMELSALRISLETQQQEFIDAFLKATPKEAAKLAEGLAMRSIAETKQAIDLGTAEAGRVLRSLQSSIALTENLVTLKTLSDKGLLDESDVKLFQAMLKNPSANAAQVLSARSKAAQKGWGDLYYQMYFNSLLSNPSTWGLNIGTTAIWTAYQVPHEILTSAVDAAAYMAHKIPGLRAVLNKFYYQGKPAQRQLYMRDVFSSIAGFATGGVRGAGKGAFILATGQHPTGAGWMESRYDPDLSGDNLETHQLFVGSKSETVNKLVRKTGGVLSIPTRVMRASDAVFNTIAYERKLTQIIGREIKNRKMSKSMAKKFADDVRNSGHPAYEMFHIEAAQAARYSTFNDAGGKLTRYLMLMRHNSHLVRLMLPFLRTIVNLQKRALEMTPGLGLAIDAMARNDPKANRIHGHSIADSIAKQIEGMAIAAVLMLAIDDEDITANAPENPKERANFYAQGKIPWAVKIGDTWHSYRALDPFGPMLSMLASFKQEFRNPQRMAQAEFDERMLAFSNTIFDNVLSSVWINNFGEYAETRTAADKAKTIGRRLESMLIPFSGLMRFADRLETYPNQFLKERTGNLLVDNAPKLAALVEGLTGVPLEAGRNAINVWGEDIVIRHDNAFNFFFPLAWSKDKMDKTEQYFGDLGYYPSYPPKTFKVGYTQYKLDDDLWVKAVVGFGDKAKPAITKIIESSSFRKAPPQIQAKIISNILAKYRAPYVAKAKAEQFKRGLVEAPIRVYERPPDEG